MSKAKKKMMKMRTRPNRETTDSALVASREGGGGELLDAAGAVDAVGVVFIEVVEDIFNDGFYLVR